MLPSSRLTAGRPEQKQSPQGLEDTGAYYPGLSSEKELLPIHARGLGIQESQRRAVGTVVSACPHAQGSQSPASRRCPETRTCRLAPHHSFPGFLLRARGEQPLLRAPPLPAAPLCRKSGPSGSPSDCPPEAHIGAAELA